MRSAERLQNHVCIGIQLVYVKMDIDDIGKITLQKMLLVHYQFKIYTRRISTIFVTDMDTRRPMGYNTVIHTVVNYTKNIL